MLNRARLPRLIGLAAVLLVIALPTTEPATAAPSIGLRQIAVRKGVYIGTMLSGVRGKEILDTKVGRTVCTEFNMLSTGNALKFSIVHPRPGQYDWVPAERLYAVATACNQKFVGTPLVWHQQVPAWVRALDGQPARLRKVLKEHVTRVVKHFAGRISVWDVVNEAIETNGALKDTIWLRNLGPGFIVDAFKWAHAADANAELYYNEYSSDGMRSKGNAVYRWVRAWKARGAPIDGVGIQAHGPLESRSQPEVVANLRRLAKLGLSTRLSEIGLPIGPLTYADRKAQSDMFYTLASACFAPGTGCRMFTVWGVSDRDYRPVAVWRGACCGLLFDEAFVRKPAYFAVRDALSTAVSAGGA